MGPYDRDQIEDFLDGSLKRYSEVEPRAGLEGRVLAHVAARVGAPRLQRAWPLVGANVCLLVFCIWMVYRSEIKPKGPVAGSVTEITVPPISVVPVQQAASQPKASKPRRPPSVHIVTLAGEPKLKQFPSPRPISTQEAMLVEYVKAYPQEAMLIAQQQNEFQHKVEQAQKEIGKSLGSNQQER